MAKKLSCWLGRHTWTTRVAEGESHKVCSACGKTRRDKDDIDGSPPNRWPEYDKSTV